MNIQESLDYINSVSWKGSVPGLDRITELMHKLGDPQDQLRFVHIGGTNGKGSTAAFLSNILRAAGYQTGLFISPFVEVFNERMQINNQYISDEELAAITTYIRPFAESMPDAPTEFELYTAIAMEYFRRNHCDIVVLEVGMGGEFDATNVIRCPEVAVLTATGLDHTAYLGNTVEQIAATKAGIIKQGSRAVLYRQSPEVTRVIASRCDALQVPLYISDPNQLELLERGIDGQKFRSPYGILSVKLAASYQKYNLAAALKTVDVLRCIGWQITDRHIQTGLEQTVWPGRFEVLSKHPVFLVDGAHNPHGMAAAAESLQAIFPDQKLLLILGVLADKDYRSMLDRILPLARKVLCVTPDNPRALPAAELADAVRRWSPVTDQTIIDEESVVRTENYAESSESASSVPAEVCGSVRQAIDKAFVPGEPDDVICAIGSLYMISEVKEIFREGTVSQERKE